MVGGCLSPSIVGSVSVGSPRLLGTAVLKDSSVFLLSVFPLVWDASYQSAFSLLFLRVQTPSFAVGPSPASSLPLNLSVGIDCAVFFCVSFGPNHAAWSPYVIDSISIFFLITFHRKPISLGCGIGARRSFSVPALLFAAPLRFSRTPSRRATHTTLFFACCHMTWLFPRAVPRSQFCELRLSSLVLLSIPSLFLYPVISCQTSFRLRLSHLTVGPFL